MNDDLTAWFHCGHCASLFRAIGGEAEDRRCTVCGEDPSIGLDAGSPVAAAPVKSNARDPMLRVRMAEVETPKFQKREVRHYKGQYFALKLVAAWALAMAVLAVIGHFYWRDKPRESKNELIEKAAVGTLGDEDLALLGRAYQKCVVNLSGFLSAGTPEERNQFVRTPIDTAGRMARFYQNNPLINLDLPTIKGTGGGVIRLKDGRRLIETRWEVNDGREFDAVFFDENGAWRLDWEEFVRYGEHPWMLFLGAGGDEEGEFRLFARERLAGQRSDISQLRIVLLAPRFGYPAETGSASPEFLIDQDSEAGRLLKAAFDARKDGGRIYGSSMANHDPEGMIRVRVRVRRSDGTLGRQFTIEEVKACHWLSIEDPGADR